MMTRLNGLQKAAMFYVLAFGLACLVAVAVPDTSDGAPAITMFTPLMAVLVMLLVVTRDGYHRAVWSGLGLHRAGLRSWGTAILVPAGVVAGSYLVAAGMGVVRLGRPDAPDPADLLAGVAVSLLLGLAEEIGWRGYLLPLVRARSGTRAAAVVGLLHGAWHLPLMIFTTSYNALGSRWVTIPVMLAVFTYGGIFYGHLRTTSGALWPVVVAHQAFNSVSEGFDAVSTTGRPDVLATLVGETGVLTLVLTALVALALVRRERLAGAGTPSGTGGPSRSAVAR